MMLTRFRETLWFKRGLLDEAPRDDDAPVAPGSHLPIEDRYLDDGSVSREDSLAFSVRTGTTQHLPTGLSPDDAPGPAFEAGVLVRQLKRGRHTIAMTCAAVVAVMVVAGVALL